MSATLDLLADTFPHGTHQGFAGGCRSAACPAPLSCRDLHQRYAGDWAFRKLVDAGHSLEEILALDAAERAGARTRDRAAARTEQARHSTSTTKPRPRPQHPRKTAKPAAAPSTRPAPERTTRCTPLVTDDRTHPGFAWIEERRKTIGSSADVADPRWAQRLDEYEHALQCFVRTRGDWKTTNNALRQAVRSARAQLTQAQLAARTGLSLGGAIAAALRNAQANYDQADAALTQHAATRPPQPARPRLLPEPRRTRTAGVAKPREVQPHGTNACRARGCTRPECIEAGRRYHREWVAARKQKSIPIERHGTAYGYMLGCTDRKKCPAEISCSDASLAEERRRRREADIPERAPQVPAEETRQHIRNLMTSGWRLLEIAHTAEVSPSSLKSLLYGRSGARKGETPTLIKASTSASVLKLIPRTTPQVDR